VPVPFNTAVPVETGGGTYGWAGEGKPKVVGSFAFATVTLGMTKVSGETPVTKELIRGTTPAHVAMLDTILTADIVAVSDLQFVDPSAPATANVRPGSVTAGLTAILPSGTTSAALVKDMGTMAGAFWTANPDATNVAILMSLLNYSILSTAPNSPLARDGTYG